MSTQTRVSVRWMIRADVRAAIACGVGMSTARILRHLRQRNVIGVVAEDGNGRVVGCALYRIGRPIDRHKPGADFLRVLALAVRPDRRRQGIGSTLLAYLVRKLHTHRKRAAVFTVPESALPAQLLLRAEGWACERVLPEKFGPEDGYQFVYRV